MLIYIYIIHTHQETHFFFKEKNSDELPQFKRLRINRRWARAENDDAHHHQRERQGVQNVVLKVKICHK